MLRINCGSGQRPFAKPFINVDVQAKWNPDVVADGAHMPMFEDGSADVIVLHQTLEHYGCNEGNAMIQECHRILCAGGSLIVSVPDMRELAKAWLRGQMTDQLYFTSVYGAFMGDEADRHRWGWDRAGLLDYLRGVAIWTDVKPFDWREIPGASIARDWWINCAEAIK